MPDESSSKQYSSPQANRPKIRPENSRLVPPRQEVDEWREIYQRIEHSERRHGKLRTTATADGGTLVERTGTPEGRPDGVLPPPIPGSHPSLEVPLPCPACGSPRSAETKYCVACGTSLDDGLAANEIKTNDRSRAGGVATASDKGSAVFHCQNCGSDIATDVNQRAYRCPFCDSTYVAEIDATQGDRRKPEFVLGFSVTREQALEKFSEWIQRRGWFRPGDLSLRAISDKQMGVYVPFWHYAYSARSNWRVSIGQYWYRTETYTVTNAQGKRETRTRVVRETEWDPLSGSHSKYYFGYLVSASKGLTHDESLSIQPYDLRALVRFQPYYLAGWISEEYAIDYPSAQSIAEDEFQRREYNNIRNMMPGDTHANLQVDTRFELNETDLILLPVHILSYRYRDRVYRFLVNGQTGKFAGEKPLSGVRIAIAVMIAIAILAVVILTVMFLQSGGLR